MSHDPGFPDDEDADESSKKTRLVVRPESAKPGAPDALLGGAGTPRRGTVIGTTRLVSSPGQAAASESKRHPAAGKTVRMQSQGKTQYVREGAAVDTDPVAGWIVVVKGPGRGGFRPIYVGMNSIGRGADQRIRIDFGDESISRKEHAFITYDDKTRTFYLHHGGKPNLVRLGGKPVLQPTELKPFDRFAIGNTTFRFVANCGPDFCWSSEAE